MKTPKAKITNHRQEPSASSVKQSVRAGATNQNRNATPAMKIAEMEKELTDIDVKRKANAKGNYDSWLHSELNDKTRKVESMLEGYKEGLADGKNEQKKIEDNVFAIGLDNGAERERARIRALIEKIYDFVENDHELWDDHTDYDNDMKLWRKELILAKIKEILEELGEK